MAKKYTKKQLEAIREGAKKLTDKQRADLKKRLVKLAKEKRNKAKPVSKPAKKTMPVSKQAKTERPLPKKADVTKSLPKKLKGDDGKKKKIQDYQKTKRMSSDAIGKNKPTSISAKNSYSAKNPIKSDKVGGYTKSGPEGETVRKNSKGQHYYINKAGNAVIVKKK